MLFHRSQRHRATLPATALTILVLCCPWVAGSAPLKEEPKPAATPVAEPAPAGAKSLTEERYSLAGGRRLELKFTTTAVTPARLYVRINHGAFRTVESGTVRLFEDGLYQIGWYAEDSLGKRGTVQERTIRIDSTPPQLSYTVRSAPTGKAELRLRAVDPGVGVAKIEWRAKAEDPWLAYSEPLSFPLDAPIAISARATDSLGNVSPDLSISVVLNRVPSAVVALFREPYARSDGDGRIYVVKRQVPIPPGMDANSVELMEEGQPVQRLRPGSMLQFPEDGKRRLVFRVSDEHGNSIDTAVDVVVDTTAPRSQPVQIGGGGRKP